MKIKEKIEDPNNLFEDFYKEEKKIKAEYKKKLKGLINVTGLYKKLDENSYWHPVDIVELELTTNTIPGYKQYQHARIIGDKSRKLYIKINDTEIRNVDHYYVWQICGYADDDYSGYMLFPLKNNKYFKVYYNC